MTLMDKKINSNLTEMLKITSIIIFSSKTSLIFEMLESY